MLKKTMLYDDHVKLSAQMIPFSGYLIPFTIIQSP